MTHTVAAEIRRRRAARGMSAQQLADRCAQLGMEVPRATLADLENGRRTTLTVPELLIIARALEVAPVLLVAPAGTGERVEISPGQRLQSWDAAAWASGLVRLHETATGPEVIPADDDDVMPLFLLHDELLEDWQHAGPNEAVRDKDGNVVMEPGEMRRAALRRLRRHRSRMRKVGLVPPGLPPELAHLDEPEVGGDEPE